MSIQDKYVVNLEIGKEINRIVIKADDEKDFRKKLKKYPYDSIVTIQKTTVLKDFEYLLREDEVYESIESEIPDYDSIMEDLGFNDYLPNGDILFKSFCEFFTINPRSLSPQMKRFRDDLGDDYITYKNDEAKEYKAELYREYNHTILPASITTLSKKGFVVLMRLINVSKSQQKSNVVLYSPNKYIVSKENNKVDSDDSNLGNLLLSSLEVQKEILQLLKENKKPQLNQQQQEYTIDKLGNVTYL